MTDFDLRPASSSCLSPTASGDVLSAHRLTALWADTDKEPRDLAMFARGLGFDFNSHQVALDFVGQNCAVINSTVLAFLNSRERLCGNGIIHTKSSIQELCAQAPMIHYLPTQTSVASQDLVMSLREFEKLLVRMDTRAAHSLNDDIRNSIWLYRHYSRYCEIFHSESISPPPEPIGPNALSAPYASNTASGPLYRQATRAQALHNAIITNATVSAKAAMNEVPILLALQQLHAVMLDVKHNLQNNLVESRLMYTEIKEHMRTMTHNATPPSTREPVIQKEPGPSSNAANKGDADEKRAYETPRLCSLGIFDSDKPGCWYLMCRQRTSWRCAERTLQDRGLCLVQKWDNALRSRTHMHSLLNATAAHGFQWCPRKNSLYFYGPNKPTNNDVVALLDYLIRDRPAGAVKLEGSSPTTDQLLLPDCDVSILPDAGAGDYVATNAYSTAV